MNTRNGLFLFATLLVAGLCSAQTAGPSWEEKFRAIPSAEKQREYMKRLTARPHHLGSSYNKENADWMLSLFQSWGFDARLESFDVLFPSPKERRVELVEPKRFTAKLQEPAVAKDPTSNQQREQLPTYNAYSADGDVTATLVYVNYGIPADYEQLERMGISVKGCIVIARYGASWRGIKPKLAAEKGAVGCIIYSDPHEDGYFQGEVFPEGAYRNRDGVQRGSVMDMPLYPGDPLTPGIGATKEARRLPMDQVQTFTKIPVLPISYGDTQPLLEALTGPVAPESWRGALPLTYRIGPGPAKVRLNVMSNWDIKTIYNVIVTIRGSEFPDEWVIRGNHRDAWVNGAQDPISGMVAVMEELRALSELQKQGWKPKRTIIYAGWDGEEQGLLGSTEWAETHADELKQKTVVYINTDSNSRGYLGMSGSHTLEKFLNGVAKEIIDPVKNISAWKRVQLHRIARGNSEERHEARTRSDLRISALGSGSDYTAFIDHLGVASLNIGFGGESGGGIYHSIYDDFYWYTNFGDHDFAYGRALSQTGGTATIRMADAGLLPFDFVNLAETVRKYSDEIKRLLKNTQDDVRERNRQIAEGVFSATEDPRKPMAPPLVEEVPPYLNFAPLDNAIDVLVRSADRYDKAVRNFKQGELSSSALKGVNAKLIQSERKLTHPDGLPGRPWFKHLIYAPGFYTGYGVKTIPGVREAIEQKKWEEAEREITRVSNVLREKAALVSSAVELLEGNNH